MPRRPRHLILSSLCLALTAACGGAPGTIDPPRVTSVKPGCGDNAVATAVSILGTLPVQPEVSLANPSGSTLDTSYRAWVGTAELGSVSWKDGGRLTAVVPAGLAAGTYGVTVEGPGGGRGTLEGAFEVRAGQCPIETAALAVTNPAVAPATVTVGQEVTVTATVENRGQSAAEGVVATIVSAPAGFTPAGGPGSPQEVPGGQARSFSWRYTATAAGGGVFVVEAAGTAADTRLAVTASAVNTNAVLVNPGAFLAATALVVPARATVGQLVTVILTVTNQATSAVEATPALAVSGPVTAGNAPAARSIPAGTSQAFQWTYTAGAPGTASFTASVSGTDPGSGAAVTVPTAPVEVVLQGPPSLLATLAIPAVIELGDFTVTMLVTNGGGAAGADVAEVVPDAPAVQGGSTAAAVLKSGPTGSPALVVAGQPATAFTWVFTATSAGTLTLATRARGHDANSGAAVVSGLAASGAAQVAMHTVGGMVSGLAGIGLVLHNGADSLPVGANGTFTFPTPVPSGGTYAVSVTGQPGVPTQICTVANGSGTVGSTDVTDVAVTCATSAFTVGGTVSGLAGAGLVLHNGADSLPVGANGTFTFPTTVASGAGYEVSVSAQPGGPSQVCSVAGGSGTVGAAAVTTVNVVCSTSAFTVGGTVSGLAGTGLVLRNGADSLSVGASGTFTFPTPVASGGTYAVTVTGQPSVPTQVCTITPATASGTVGAANVTNVAVTCATSAFTVGGTVSGLAGTGLVLRNGTDSLPVTANGAFTFSTPVPSGGTYAVTVTGQPSVPTQVCTITPATASGTVGAANVTNVAVTCATSAFTVGGTVSGLAGTGLVLRNGTDSLPVTANGAFTFSTPVPSGGTYAVTVTGQPSVPTQVCAVTPGTGSGTVGAAAVATVNVVCATSAFTVGGTVSGLAGTGLVLHNGADSLSVAAGATTFTFPAPVPSGGTYAVTVTGQPSVPTQVCTITPATASGTVGAANVTNVAVTCATSAFTVGGTVSGLAGTGLVLHNGTDSLPVSANGTFTFSTPVPSGGTYAVTVTGQPSVPTQVCTITPPTASGTVGAAAVATVNVVCATSAFTVGGTVSGLAGTGLVLHNGTDSLPVSANGAFTFSTPVPSGGTYAVTVTGQPSVPTQVCTVTPGTGSGTVGALNVTSVAVTCATSAFTVGGTVSGLAGTGLVLHNGADNLPVSANGTFTFQTPVPSGGAYAVTVTGQPAGPTQVCTITAGTGSGTVGALNVTSVAVTCATSAFTVGGTVSGLRFSGLVLRNGAENLTIGANGPFTFAAPVSSGASYAVTVQSQPFLQSCAVAGGSGIVGGAAVTTVDVACSP